MSKWWIAICLCLAGCGPSSCGRPSEFPPLKALLPGHCVAYGRIWPAHKDGDSWVCRKGIFKLAEDGTLFVDWDQVAASCKPQPAWSTDSALVCILWALHTGKVQPLEPEPTP